MSNFFAKPTEKVVKIPVPVQFLPVLIQFLLLLSALYILIKLEPNLEEFAYVFIGLTVSMLLSIFLGRKLIAASLKDAQLKVREAMVENMIKLNAAVAEQNEKFIGQILEISNLYHQQQFDHLASYLGQISNDISQVNDALKVNQPIVGALLKNKLTEACVRNIHLDIDISVSLARQKENAHTLARILGNLIDNAFEAVLTENEEDRLVQVEVSQTGPLLKIVVCNKVPLLRPEAIDHIFQAGYTLKGGAHSGMGLNIVKTLAESLYGMVSVTSTSDTGTKFVVLIPAK